MTSTNSTRTPGPVNTAWIYGPVADMTNDQIKTLADAGRSIDTTVPDGMRRSTWRAITKAANYEQLDRAGRILLGTERPTA